MAKGKAPAPKGSPAKKTAPAKKRIPRAAAAALSATVAELPQPTFVFQGTVLAVGSTTLDEVPAEPETIVARVDDIHVGPPITQDFLGQTVTVRLGAGQTVEPGEAYLFHTASWVFGAGLAVVCLALEPAHAEAVAALQTKLSDSTQQAMHQRAARADLIVQGHVSQVREVKREDDHPITEHDPHWQDAVVQVHAAPGAVQGRGVPKQVVVRFASSRDVRWARAPKFKVGKKGVWLLGDTSKPVAAARNAMAMSKDHYLCVEPDDFYTEEQAPAAIAALIAVGTPGGRS